jgi:hypothetical protein
MRNTNDHTPADTTQGVTRQLLINPLNNLSPEQVYGLVNHYFFVHGYSIHHIKDTLFDLVVRTTLDHNSGGPDTNEINFLYSLYSFFSDIHQQSEETKNLSGNNAG